MKEEKDSRKAVNETRPFLEEILSTHLVDEKYLRPAPDRPASYLVYRPADRSYSVVSMVWGAGQKFPIHDHLSWGLIGVYSQSIREERFDRLDDGSKEGYAAIEQTGITDFSEGQILEEGLLFDANTRSDIHRILNPAEKPAVSIHILASDLGMKHRNQYDQASNTIKKFISGYDDPEGRIDGRIVGGNDKSKLIEAQPHVTLDVTGLECPFPTQKTLHELSHMARGEILEVKMDSEDSAYDELPTALRTRGLEYVILEHHSGFWKAKVQSESH